MKILVVCQYYHPEPFRVSDICEELVKKGHEVTVLTGIPNYPEGVIYEGYQKRKHEEINGVEVYRSYTIPRRSGAIYRFLNYYSYALSSTLKVAFNKIKPKSGGEFDVVLVNQLSPVMMAYAGIKYKEKHSKKLIMYCLDLWPESLVAGGIKRNSPIFKLFHRISKKIYKKCDKILVTSKMFTDYLKNEFNLEEKNIEYLPQYAESIFSPADCKKIPNETIDFMFAGNIGSAQKIDTIIKVAYKCKNISNIQWHIVGDGSELEKIKKLSEELGLVSIHFYGRQPLEKMPEYYSKADAMLITMEADPIISLTLPGKVQTYMAAGKAIIGCIDGETQMIIDDAKCGYCSAAENIELFLDNIKKYISLNKNETMKMEQNSRNYYEQNFSKDRYIDQLIKVLGNESEVI